MQAANTNMPNPAAKALADAEQTMLNTLQAMEVMPEIGGTSMRLPITSAKLQMTPGEAHHENLQLVIEGDALDAVGFDVLKGAVFDAANRVPILAPHIAEGRSSLGGYWQSESVVKDEIIKLEKEAGDKLTPEKQAKLEEIKDWQGLNAATFEPTISVEKTTEQCVKMTFDMETDDKTSVVSPVTTIGNAIVEARDAITKHIMDKVKQMKTESGEALFSAEEQDQLDQTTFDMADAGTNVELLFGILKEGMDDKECCETKDKYGETPLQKVNPELLKPIMTEAVLANVADKHKGLAYQMMADDKRVLKDLKDVFEGTGVDLGPIEKSDIFMDYREERAKKDTKPEAARFDKQYNNPEQFILNVPLMKDVKFTSVIGEINALSVDPKQAMQMNAQDIANTKVENVANQGPIAAVKQAVGF